MITLREAPERARPDLLDRFAGIATADVVDALGGRGAIDPGIGRLFPSKSFVGSALTIDTPPNDNLAPYAALELARPGDVAMISTGDFTGGATIGDTLLNLYNKRGVVGVVLDGLVRDLDGIEAIGMPTYARGLSPNAPQKHGPGFVGFDIIVGGVAVAQGDIVIGDRDGVVIVPRQRAEDVLAAVELKKHAAGADTTEQADLPEWLETFLGSNRVRRV
jgi:4-hydroxy-4-methyl-2-oxoglutarate aldolase